MQDTTLAAACVCGATIRKPRRGPTARHCGAYKCASALRPPRPPKQRSTLTCPTCKSRDVPVRSKYCSKDCRPSNPMRLGAVYGVCGHCQAPTTRRAGTPGPPAKYCTIACKSAANEARAAATGRLAEWRAATRVKYVPTWHERVCQVCETPFQAKRPTAKLCSKICRSRADYERQKAAGLKPDVLVRWTSGTCRRCGAWFVAAPVGPPGAAARAAATRHCSATCANGIRHERRRARERDAFVQDVDRVAIFERDGWICQLCNRPTDRAASVPARQAPTIDHIIPLAQGGTHEPANVQCAHFSCNCAKRDRLML